MSRFLAVITKRHARLAVLDLQIATRRLSVVITNWNTANRRSSRRATHKYQTNQLTAVVTPLRTTTQRFSNSQFTAGKFNGKQETAAYNIFHKYKKIMDAPAGVFQGSVDRFNGVTVDSEDEYVPGEDFAVKLQKSLEHWRANGNRAIWFKVRTSHANWVPVLTQHGFEFHHAKSGFVLLNCWLPTKEMANIPVFAHTMMGVGGLVVNVEAREVLVVTDRFAMIPNSWKLPGGYVEPGEDLVDAAIREVREETGIDSEFETVVSIRHSHGGSFDCSDVYVVVALRPKNLEFQRCEREIARVRWMPITEYLQHPHVHETNRHFLRTFLDYQERGIQFTSEAATHSVLRRKYRLYYMKPLKSAEEDSDGLAADLANPQLKK